MKSIIPKALLEWKEPKAMRMAKDEMANRERSPWFKPGILLFIIAMIMVNWWLVQHDPQKTPPSFQNALLIALFGGIFFAYIVPWMLSFCPSSICIFDHGIYRKFVSSGSWWYFDDIERCEFISFHTGDTALVIHTSKTKRIILGIPTELSAKASQVLSEMNVKIEKTSQPRH